VCWHALIFNRRKSLMFTRTDLPAPWQRRPITLVHLTLILLVSAGLVSAGLVSQPVPVAAATTPPEIRMDTWVTDGIVHSVVQSGNTIYLGGDFSYVGPTTGSFAQLDAATGAAATLPATDGSVMAIAADGAGGWYIGGTFTKVGDAARSKLAHILANGTLDPAWNPTADDIVWTLAVSGNTVYVGGQFAQIGGQARSRIAALDGATGLATVWNPNPNGGRVYTLAVSRNTVYVGAASTILVGRRVTTSLPSMPLLAKLPPGALIPANGE
jgi:hypothetical protein